MSDNEMPEIPQTPAHAAGKITEYRLMTAMWRMCAHGISRNLLGAHFEVHELGRFLGGDDIPAWETPSEPPVDVVLVSVADLWRLRATISGARSHQNANVKDAQLWSAENAIDSMLASIPGRVALRKRNEDG